MPPRCSGRRALLAALPALAALGALAGFPRAEAAEGPLALAKISLVDRRVELSGPRATWQSAVEGVPLHTGEALRTGPDGTARLDLPWMSLTLGPRATLRFPDAAVLSATLDAGRALVEAPARDALKLVTAEAEVYGRGRAVVRRDGRVTTVSCLAGRFQVAGAAGAVTLAAGRGTVVRAGLAPSPSEPLPAAPAAGLWPAKDPVYVSSGVPLELRWTGTAASYQVELLPVGSDVVLVQRDVAAAPLRVEVPWEGAFRWRVSARDGRGVEGAPSDEGLIAVEP
jgi:hypothetical protein